MTQYIVGMNTCASIRSKSHPGERCSAKTQTGSEWCGKHKTSCVRFLPRQRSAPPITNIVAGQKIFAAWRRWLARRAGPLLWYRAESNNPFDFFSADPVEEIPLASIISFVTEGKGYIMDIKSAVSLIAHAEKSKETPLNPFNRAQLPPIFLKRVTRHATKIQWEPLVPVSEVQTTSLAVTDVFRCIEDLGYYTDPSWFMNLSRLELQQIYIELADIWFHRASLSSHDRLRIVPVGRPFAVPVITVRMMQRPALRNLVLNAFRMIISAAVNRADKQLGVMYVLGSLSIVSAEAGVAYPWLVDMFMPGVTRIVGTDVIILHPSVLLY